MFYRIVCEFMGFLLDLLGFDEIFGGLGCERDWMALGNLAGHGVSLGMFLLQPFGDSMTFIANNSKHEQQQSWSWATPMTQRGQG